MDKIKEDGGNKQAQLEAARSSIKDINPNQHVEKAYRDPVMNIKHRISCAADEDEADTVIIMIRDLYDKIIGYQN